MTGMRLGLLFAALVALSCAHEAPAVSTAPATRHNATRAHAQTIVEQTAAFQQLMKDQPRVGLMADDGDDRHTGQFDFRAYVENADGEISTVARYRVDFAHKQVLRYAAEDDAYQPIAGSTALFD